MWFEGLMAVCFLLILRGSAWRRSCLHEKNVLKIIVQRDSGHISVDEKIFHLVPVLLPLLHFPQSRRTFAGCRTLTSSQPLSSPLRDCQENSAGFHPDSKTAVTRCKAFQILGGLEGLRRKQYRSALKMCHQKCLSSVSRSSGLFTSLQAKSTKCSFVRQWLS